MIRVWKIARFAVNAGITTACIVGVVIWVISWTRLTIARVPPDERISRLQLKEGLVEYDFTENLTSTSSLAFLAFTMCNHDPAKAESRARVKGIWYFPNDLYPLTKENWPAIAAVSYPMPAKEIKGVFAWRWYKVRRAGSRGTDFQMAFPAWVFALPIVPWGAYWMWRGTKRLLRRHQKLCLSCGYDLCGSGVYCPECGTVTEQNLIVCHRAAVGTEARPLHETVGTEARPLRETVGTESRPVRV